ncbi:hypothetical protein SAMN04487785_102429 [Dyella jiangningensis]|uniref:hypothetical protein n=1 Tax=Dyella sp. AtDHG13 TaxID=1938897 RepID=UPI000887DA67|nr:hypothetical protein [Dyella sp. AtDHG13]PXV60701.1 hypothetical protein BDW41_102428 [Dyella sp. AtDHG13]SDJ55708.1 hypothetical protein SAMN04487785_102429 [Dyella jiangningensis]
MGRLALSMIPTAYRLNGLATASTDEALRIVAKHLDLPMEDSETVDFLRHAFASAETEIRLEEAKQRVARLKESSND